MHKASLHNKLVLYVYALYALKILILSSSRQVAPSAKNSLDLTVITLAPFPDDPFDGPSAV